MGKRWVPGYTFADLVRKPDLEAALAKRRSFSGEALPEQHPAFLGTITMPGGQIEASVVRSAASYGGLVGLFEMDFFATEQVGQSRETITVEFGLPRSWLTEDQVTDNLQKAAVDLIYGPTSFTPNKIIAAVLLALTTIALIAAMWTGMP